MTPRRASSIVLILAMCAATLVAGALPAAGDDTITVKMMCGFADPAVWNADTASNAYDTELIITAPGSVTSGEAFEVTVDAEPMKNGPVAIRSAGDAVITAVWDVSGSTTDGEVESESWENAGPIGVLEEYDIDPLVLPLVAGDSGSVDLEWQKFKLLAIGTITLVCNAFEPDGSGELLYPIVSVPIGESSDGGSTTTTTTSAATTTTTTVAATTTTAEPVDVEPYVAQVVSQTVDVTYMCTPEVNGEELEGESWETTAAVASVDKVNSGQTFTVGIKFDPGPENGTEQINIGEMSITGSATLAGASPEPTVDLDGGGNTAVIEANSAMQLPSLDGKVTADGEPGDTIDVAPGTVVIDVTAQATTTTCEPSEQADALSVMVVSEPVDLQNDGDLPFTGLSRYMPFLVVAAVLVYSGLILLSALPPRRRADRST